MPTYTCAPSITQVWNVGVRSSIGRRQSWFISVFRVGYNFLSAWIMSKHFSTRSYYNSLVYILQCTPPETAVSGLYWLGSYNYYLFPSYSFYVHCWVRLWISLIPIINSVFEWDVMQSNWRLPSTLCRHGR